MRLVHYSVCRVCGEAVPYAGKGRPKQYCQKCKDDGRRVYMTNYMNGYRRKQRKMFSK